MTKSELFEKISESLKLPAGKAELIVNCVFDSMVAALERGEGIEIRGLGSFTVREYKAYEGRNPRTGETVHVAPKRLPFFKVGKDLRERVNAATGTPLPADSSPDHDDDVAEARVAAPRSAENLDALHSLGAGVVGDLERGSHLDHRAYSSTNFLTRRTTMKRLSREIGRCS